jgi:hypothetical protein
MSEIAMLRQLRDCLPSGGSDNFLLADNPGVIPSCPESQCRVGAPQRIPNYKGKCSEFGATVSELPFVD